VSATFLRSLRPGTRFRVLGLPLEGRLVRRTPCSCTVVYDERTEHVVIGEREFDARRGAREEWSGATLVEVLP
jgi:hypothetical protein